VPVPSISTAEGYFSIFKRGMKGIISIAPRSICIATLPNTISGSITAPPSVLILLLVLRPAGVWRIVNLTKPGLFPSGAAFPALAL
jgi:hypothetical protein